HGWFSSGREFRLDDVDYAQDSFPKFTATPRWGAVRVRVVLSWVLSFKDLVDSDFVASRSMVVIAVTSASFVNAASAAFLGPRGTLRSMPRATSTPATPTSCSS